MRIIGRLHTVIRVVVENRIHAFAGARRTGVRTVRVARHSIREDPCRTFHIKDVVVDVGARRPAGPIGVEYEVHVLAFANIDRVVVDERVLHRPGELDAAMVVVLADVVADDRAGISRAVVGAL